MILVTRVNISNKRGVTSFEATWLVKGIYGCLVVISGGVHDSYHSCRYLGYSH